MSRQIKIQPEADKDLDHIAYHIARDNVDAALRLLDAAQMTFEFLADLPFLGVSCASFFKSTQAKELRLWRIKGFANYQILYQVTDHELLIVRVVHAARDLKQLMDA